jgi:hypothetical protein
VIEYISDAEMEYFTSILNTLIEKKGDMTKEEVLKLNVLMAWKCPFTRDQVYMIQKMNKKYILDGVECG